MRGWRFFVYLRRPLRLVLGSFITRARVDCELVGCELVGLTLSVAFRELLPRIESRRQVRVETCHEQ